MATTSAQVQQLYVAYLGRAADKAGLDYWLNELNADTPTLTLENLRANFVTEQPEYAAIYGGLDRSAQVTKIYENLFGRAPDAAGLAYWTTGEGSTVNADQLLTAFINGAAASDATVVNNKVFVAQAYTDAAGAEFNANAAAAVIADVDGTPASVTDALNAITTGTLEGQVPALGLINAYAAAQDAVTAYGTEVAKANPSFDTGTKDGIVTATEASAALTAAQNDRAVAANGGTATTATLSANVTNATDALAAAKEAAIAVNANAGATVTAYDNAVAADTAADAAVTANAAAAASALAGLDTAVKASGSAVTYVSLAEAAGVAAADLNTAAKVATFLADPAQTATARAGLVTELNKVGTYGAEVVKAGDLALAAAKTQATLDTATTSLKAIDTDPSTPTVSEGNDYIVAQAALKTAATTLANAQTADAKVAAVKVVVDQFTALNKSVGDAQTALTKFNTDNSDKVTLHAVGTGAVTDAGTDAKSDVFFFSSKIDTANDGTIASFGSGDSIVLNSSLTFNSGALTAGDNNKSEFFLVQKGADVQLVIETAAYGSSDAVTTGGPSAAADHAAVITLTGVNVADLSVHNGVVSHVA